MAALNRREFNSLIVPSVAAAIAAPAIADAAKPHIPSSVGLAVLNASTTTLIWCDGEPLEIGLVFSPEKPGPTWHAKAAQHVREKTWEVVEESTHEAFLLQVGESDTPENRERLAGKRIYRISVV